MEDGRALLCTCLYVVYVLFPFYWAFRRLQEHI